LPSRLKFLDLNPIYCRIEVVPEIAAKACSQSVNQGRSA